MDDEMEVPISEDDLELSMDIPEEPEEEEEIPISFETEGTEEGGDLSLIPEGFIVEADDDFQPFQDDPEDDVDAISGEDLDIADAAPQIEAAPAAKTTPGSFGEIPSNLKQELKTVLSYMDQLLEALPDEKIEEFARSEYYDTYKKLFKELGLV
jgi:hypothetical protein